nr:hypothetical protein [Tanacetum cinerariifolium]
AALLECTLVVVSGSLCLQLQVSPLESLLVGCTCHSPGCPSNCGSYCCDCYSGHWIVSWAAPVTSLHIGARGFPLALFYPSKLDRVFSTLLPLIKIQAECPPQLFESIDAPARQLTEPVSRIPH